MTIARLWHGRTRAADADVYMDYLNRTGIPDYKATPGNLGVTVLRRVEGDVAEFLLISYWESLDAIRAFAGDDLTASHYYDEDRHYLLELESTCIHYEIME